VSHSPVTAAILAELVALPDEGLAPLAERLAPLLPPSAAIASPFLTTEEAAELLRCGRRRIYGLVADGRLPRHGDGRRLLLRRADVLRLADGDVTRP